MRHAHRLLLASTVLAVASAGCAAGPQTPQWSFGPQQTPNAAPAVASSAVAPASAAPAAAEASASPAASMAGVPAESTAPSVAAAKAAPSADPNAPAYVERDPKAPPVMPGTVHDIDMPMKDVDITVAKGFVVRAWTFGGTVPGPVIRVHLGDTVRVHLTNETQMAHSIDFHASQTAMDRQMVEIQPGATFTYTFRADYAGVWMYHCGAQPALMHIANGMFGMLIVEPKGGFDKVLGPADNEFAIVQNEWYLGRQGEAIDYAKANSTAPQPDFVAFNGVAGQYADNPIPVKTGGTVRVFVLDAGPNIGTSFHVVGTIFNTVEKEGVLLQKGNADGWGAQAVDLSAAQAAIVQFSPAEDGKYAFVDHAFDMVTHGAIGFFTAGSGS